MAALVIWSADRGEWLSCPADEIIWLDRILLSGGEDRSLHRPPRCPGLRFVHHRWELFSRDPTHEVYLAPYITGARFDHESVKAAAEHILPPANAAFEPQPVRLRSGTWLIGVGTKVLPVRVRATADRRESPTVPEAEGMPATQDFGGPGDERAAPPPVADAIARVTRYFARNPAARLAMAYYYQDFIRGAFAPHPVPIAEVALALDLPSESSVSEYKKELQRRIWNSQGHQRELGEFLLSRRLIGAADLAKAMKMAADNEAAGRSGLIAARLGYGRKRGAAGG
jgi:hypothetical protein